MKKKWTMGNVALVNADTRSGESDLRSNLALLSHVEEVQPSIYRPLKRQTRGSVDLDNLAMPVMVVYFLHVMPCLMWCSGWVLVS